MKWPQTCFLHLVFLSLLFAGTACEEDYLAEPPFSQVQDTIFLDVENWFYFNPEPVNEGGVALYPFSYQIFDASFNGYLVRTPTQIFQVDDETGLKQKALFLDLEFMPGDTLFKYSHLQYQLLIDRKKVQSEDEEVFYVMRRSRIGVKRLRERSLWLISPQRGILAAANFDIDFANGQVELDMIGESSYFRDEGLIRTIKLYDHDMTWLVDKERSTIYEFDKFKGLLKSRDYQRKEDLFQYEFDKANTRQLVDFKIIQDNSQNTILLQAGDSCFYFNESLQLQQAMLCPQNLKF